MKDTAAALTIAAVLTAAACSGTTTEPGTSNDTPNATFIRDSDKELYCGLLESRAADLPDELVPADLVSALVAAGTIGDLSVVAPEEAKADWASLRRHFELVIDAATYPRDHEHEDWAAASRTFDELNAALAASITDTCPNDQDDAGS